ncbi:fibrous sheath-interacting protein 2 isoform X1 [Strigops habroptila]|uniref:fibrous sheath-interacting protein 2 isoform X1 n=1 Tax=Strigops habroptila TaxID=2489341 RepID=UPI0011CFBAB7|nr:fibrous sheath-interacting protein 2 isoform X1 [Strigops habroptila]
MEHPLAAGHGDTDMQPSTEGKRRDMSRRLTVRTWPSSPGHLGNRRLLLAEGHTQLLDLPLGVKIPVYPGTKPIFCRTILGRKLFQSPGFFNLKDPCCRLLSMEYNSLHDPHLQAYHRRKDHLQMLKREGYITYDGKVICSLKQFNEYRHYLTQLKVDAENTFRREEHKLWQELDKLEDASELPDELHVSQLREWLVHKQRKRLPSGERKRRERILAVIEKQIGRLEALEKEQRFLQWVGCKEHLGKRRDTVSTLQCLPSECAREEAPENISQLQLILTEEEEELQELAEAKVQIMTAQDKSDHALGKASHGVKGRLFARTSEAEFLQIYVNVEDKTRLVAQEIVTTVLEILLEHLASSGPGLAARRASTAGKSGEEPAASSRVSLQTCIDKTTVEAVESVSSILSSFVGCCPFSKFLNRQDVTRPGSHRPPEQQIPGASEATSMQSPATVSRAEQQDAEIEYVRAVVLEVLETVKKKLEEKSKHMPKPPMQAGAPHRL